MTQFKSSESNWFWNPFKSTKPVDTTDQGEFYSDKRNSGMVMMPRRPTDKVTIPTTDNTFAPGISALMQEAYNSGDTSVRGSNVTSEWKELDSPRPNLYLNPSFERGPKRIFKRHTGLDYADPRVINLGNDLENYTFTHDIPTMAYGSKINWDPWDPNQPATTLDSLGMLAHETAHIKASQDNRRDEAWVDAPRGWGDSLRQWFGLPWQGAFNAEWPAIVNEWTYGQSDGTIHPNMTRKHGKSVPLRKMTNKRRTTDAYYNDMFPLVNTKKLKSEPGRLYTYWHHPDEPNKPSSGPKRIVYETPSGWWVNSFGDWEQTGGQVFDPTRFNFSDNINIARLPSFMQNHIRNMEFLKHGQPSEEVDEETAQLRDEAQDLFATLALRRKFRHSGKKTYAQLLADTINELNKVKDKVDGDYAKTNKGSDQAYQDDLAEAASNFWINALDNRLIGSKYMPVKHILFRDSRGIQDRAPMWDPNAVLEPIPIGLAGLQKKYSLSPTLDEDSDYRSPKQWRAIIRDAKYCYDLQDYINRYGPKDGGWGA